MMDFFDETDAELKTTDDFINHLCLSLSVDKSELRAQFCESCFSNSPVSPVYQTILNTFNYDCFSSDRFRMKKTKMLILTQFFEYLIAGDAGIHTLGRKLKEYDYSARCSLVWTNNYFAYRCRTCGISPSMSLCSSCFNAGNHVGHDFNKFKSLAGGACDCGDSTVMNPSGYCRYHGPDKVHNRPSPPEELIAPLRCLLPRFLPALLFWFWELCSSTDPTTLTDEVAPALYVLHVLHACGWVTQKLIADVLIDRDVFIKLKNGCAQESTYQNYLLSVATNPCFGLPSIVSGQDLVHRNLLDAFIYCTVKLRFPESLVTFLIGLLAVEDFKEEFVQSYLNHYTRIASTVVISARTRMVTDWSLQMNNRIVHISVQLFSGESLALRMVRERRLHYLLVHCLLNMCEWCRSRLDDRSNMVVNCDGPLIQNNVFWPFVSDLSNLVSHKSIVDIFVEDAEFLEAWTSVLKYMQFMNCFVLREGDHIEYETMAFYHAFTMEIEISANPMWNIWQHYRDSSEKHHCLAYVAACLSTLRKLLKNLGRLVSSNLQSSLSRSPLSLHLPLMRHVSCFMSLAVMNHTASLRQLLADFLNPNPYLLWRFMDELANTLLGCHEVIIGYWIRNGQALRQSITHYMQSQFCYSFIDLDIFAFQVCATLLPPAYVLNSLLDPTRLLRGIVHYDELLTLVTPPEPRNLDRKPLALESWLTNLCWILDLRNNICLSEDELLKKELVCVLAPEPRKRSDLASLLPEKCGINGTTKNLDDLLNKIATYSGPTCDEISGNLVSGHYYLRPSLWHTDFDPIFHSLRVTSRRETAIALEKYRDHLRQRHNVASPTTVWPPYRIPKPLPEQFMGLDHILHSRHLHFLFFIQLCLYVYGDPLVTEESLCMIIHLLNRALDTPCRTTWKGQKCSDKILKIFRENEPMDVDSTDSVVQNTCFNEFDEDPVTDTFFGLENLHDKEGDEYATAENAFVQSLGGQLRIPKRPSTSTGARSETSLQPEHFRWDSSLLRCPYPPGSSLQDNLGCWLLVENLPVPHVSLAPTVLATLAGLPQTADPVVNVIPSVPSGTQNSGLSCVLVDNLLTLLIKAHARLYWNRVSGSLDTLPKVLSGTSFVDPNVFISEGSPIGPTIDDELLDQIQVNNIHDILGEFDRVKIKRKMLPRCTAVLPGQNGLSPVSLCGTSNNMASGEAGTYQADASHDLHTNYVADLPPEIRYFAAGPPVYMLSDERRRQDSEEVRFIQSPSCESDLPCPDFTDTCFSSADKSRLAADPHCVLFGDGASYVQRLLDKIAARSSGNQSSIRLYLARARRPFESVVRILRLQPMDSLSSDSSRRLDVKESNDPLPAKILSTAPHSIFSQTVSNHPSSVSENRAGSIPVTLTCPAPGPTAATREERKKAALERRRRLMEQMASKQKAFAMTHLKDVDFQDQPSSDVIENAETPYECVICQTSDTASSAEMVLLDIMCESGITLNIRETSSIPQLVGRQPTHACGMFAEPTPRQDPSWLLPFRPPDSGCDGDLNVPSVDQVEVVPANSSCQAPSGTVGVSVLATGFDLGAPAPPAISHSGTPSVPPSPSPSHWLPSMSSGAPATGGCSFPSTQAPPCYIESRRWWALALPSSLAKYLPLLRSGLILQTCGHVVHKECFQRYRSQGGTRSGSGRNRTWVSCPLCRREVHHLLPLVPLSATDKESISNVRSSIDHISWLEKTLIGLEPDGKSVWEDLSGSEDEAIMQRRVLMSQLLGERNEATVLLRSQLECEISVLMSCPSQYPVVSRRCAWREFLLYTRRLYRKSTDLQGLLHCLTGETAPWLDECEPNLPGSPVFALCQDPGDILLSLLPHVWPREDVFLTLVAAVFCLAYVRALISVLINAPCSRSSPELHQQFSFIEMENLVQNLSGPIAVHVKHLAHLLKTLEPPVVELSTSNSRTATPDHRNLLIKAARLSDTFENEPLHFDQNHFELHIINRMLPVLRLAGLCRARWMSKEEKPGHGCFTISKLVPTGLPFVGQLMTNFGASKDQSSADFQSSLRTCSQVLPEQRMLEFSDLSRILSLDCGETALINVALVANLAASRSGILTSSVSQVEGDLLCALSDRWFKQLVTKRNLSSAVDDEIQCSNIKNIWIENLGVLVEIGRQLYPPRLIRTPYSFDVLFNALHVASCDTVQHRFQENALCLICGRLMCTLCTNLSTAMVEHAYSCEGFAGIVLEINTSIVYVSLGPSVCDWGSIYLDAYGEEDLELKRGKPLYLNEERFALLENQWLSHSFRHVLKHWRVV